MKPAQDREGPLWTEREGNRLGERDVEERGRVPRRPIEAQRTVASMDHRLQELSDHTEPERLLELGAARAQRSKPRFARCGAGRREESGLADPGYALDDQRAALTGGDRHRGRADRAKLPATLEEVQLVQRSRAHTAIRGHSTSTFDVNSTRHFRRADLRRHLAIGTLRVGA